MAIDYVATAAKGMANYVRPAAGAAAAQRKSHARSARFGCGPSFGIGVQLWHDVPHLEL